MALVKYVDWFEWRNDEKRQAAFQELVDCTAFRFSGRIELRRESIIQSLSKRIQEWPNSQQNR